MEAHVVSIIEDMRRLVPSQYFLLTFLYVGFAASVFLVNVVALLLNAALSFFLKRS